MTQPSYTQQTLRQHFRKMRKQLSEVEQELAAHGLLTQCFKLPALGEANRVACY
jgi:5-formyltetrahydrofolate cyclo-ligase